MWTTLIVFLCALALLIIGKKKGVKELKILAAILFLLGVINVFSSVGINDKEDVDQFAVIEVNTEFYEINAKYPLEDLDREGIMKSFVESQVEQKQEDWRTDGDVYKAEQEIQAEFPDRPKMVYTLYIDYEKFESEVMGTVSYLFRIGTYTGGANGDERVQTFNFYKNQKTKIDIEDIVNLSGYQLSESGLDIPNDIALSDLLLDKAQEDEDVFPSIDLLQEGLGLAYLKSDGKTLILDHQKCNCDGWFFGSNLQNFVVTDEGLRLYFGKCDITICASGSVGVLLDWESLTPYVNQNNALPALQSKEWFWIETQYNNDEVVKPQEDGVFSITFDPEGVLFVKTDCNNASGNYQVTGSELEFSGMISTLKFCEGSQESEFISMIADADNYLFTENDELVLNIKYDSGSIIFK